MEFMDISKKYGAAALIGMLLVSVTFSLCCHMPVSDLLEAPQVKQEMSGHAHHADKVQCNCGHQARNEIQKPSKIVSSTFLQVIAMSGFQQRSLYSLNLSFLTYFRSKTAGITFARPSLHLLYRVFLN